MVFDCLVELVMDLYLRFDFDLVLSPGVLVVLKFACLMIWFV